MKNIWCLENGSLIKCLTNHKYTLCHNCLYAKNFIENYVFKYLEMVEDYVKIL